MKGAFIVGAVIAAMAMLSGGFYVGTAISGITLWASVGCAVIAMILPAALFLSAASARGAVVRLSGLLLYPAFFGLLSGSMAIGAPYALASVGLTRAPVILLSFVVAFAAWGIQWLLTQWAISAVSGVEADDFRVTALAFGIVADYLPWASGVLGCVAVVMAIPSVVGAWPVPGTAAVLVVTLTVASFIGNLMVIALLRLRAAKPPDYLQGLLDEVRERTGVSLGEAIYLPRSLVNGPVLHVRLGFLGPVLIANDGVLEQLDGDERLAVLVHEAAHVAHGHLYRAVLVAAVVSFMMLLLMMSVSMTFFQNWLWVLVNAFAALTMVGLACRNFLSRRFERVADDFAAQVVGPEVVASALRKTIPPGSDYFWGTHPPLEERIRRLERAGV